MNKKEAEQKILKFFETRHKPEDVRKMKKLAASFQIKLGEKRKKFCGKCFSINLKVLGIKNKVKRVVCCECGNISRWKIT